jgi:hypothetical protein
MIKDLNIITAQGAKSYYVGQSVNNEIVDKIEEGMLYFTGDPFSHYIGYNKDGKMLFSVNCLAPCEIEYL